MKTSISPNTQAALLLTAPLYLGSRGHPAPLLTPGEYNRLVRVLQDNLREPADLLGSEAGELFKKLQVIVDAGRLTRLLERGFLLSQAIDRWQARAIWVVGRSDPDYPKRLKARLREAAPAVLYGCGDETVLEMGGLAVVGSRHVDDALIEYTAGIGRLVARAHQTVVSGGARGIDQAAMRGALQVGGRAVGVLADSLERLALARDHREYLMDERLVLVSPYDPQAGFDVGNAMQRNKMIYALSDAALVVSSDYEKGGTWAGAVEQLEKLHLVPVYVRSNGDTEKGLKALLEKGALPWPNPTSSEKLVEALTAQVQPVEGTINQRELPMFVGDKPARVAEPSPATYGPVPPSEPAALPTTPADQLFAKVKELILQMRMPKTEAEVAADLQVAKSQAKEWLRRLVDEGVLERKQKPTRYFAPTERQKSLFGTPDQREDNQP